MNQNYRTDNYMDAKLHDYYVTIVDLETGLVVYTTKNYRRLSTAQAQAKGWLDGIEAGHSKAA